MEKCDIAIVGAGPYGLSAAAHLRGLKGLDVRHFGEPMSFWERQMPEGMLLRSPWEGSHIADPGSRLTLDAYRTLNGNHHLAEPLPLENFIKYGHWFHQQAGLSADRRKVSRVELDSQGYLLVLGDGEKLSARRVIVAAGILPFAHRPKMYHGLPASLVKHTSELTDLSRFRNKEVLVVGGGQSALETAALLHAAGAHVEATVRNSTVHWLRRYPWLHSNWISWALYGSADVGPAGVSLLIQRPSLFRRLPRSIQDRWRTRAARPSGSQWLRPRLQDVIIHTGRFVRHVGVDGERLRVRLDDGTERAVDHVVLGTGYRVDIAQYQFLPPEVLRQIDIVDGYPRLDAGFESSLPGIHFLGAPAAWSFGPLMKFVAGTAFASQALRTRILRSMKGQPVFHSAKFRFESLRLVPTHRKSE